MIKIQGKLQADETRSYTKKDGTIGKVRELAIGDSFFSTVVVEVPLDLAIEKDKLGNVVVDDLKCSAKRWNNDTKKFEFVPVRFFVLGGKRE